MAPTRSKRDNTAAVTLRRAHKHPVPPKMDLVQCGILQIIRIQRTDDGLSLQVHLAPLYPLDRMLLLRPTVSTPFHPNHLPVVTLTTK